MSNANKRFGSEGTRVWRGKKVVGHGRRAVCKYHEDRATDIGSSNFNYTFHSFYGVPVETRVPLNTAPQFPVAEGPPRNKDVIPFQKSDTLAIFTS